MYEFLARTKYMAISLDERRPDVYPSEMSKDKKKKPTRPRT